MMTRPVLDLRPRMPLLVLTLLACLLSPHAAADDESDDDSKKKKDKGQLSVSLRYRFENVSQDTFDKDAHASTLRSTLAYRSPSFRGFDALVEFEDVTHVGLEYQQNTLLNGVTDRPTIADPDSTEVQQAYLRYAGLDKTSVLLGRQEFFLGNQRFVGPVGWRQNHQSFDAFRVSHTWIPRTTMHYAYVNNVNRITGSNENMQTHLLNAEVALEPGRLTPYVYRLDYDDPTSAVLSTTTYGARWEGRVQLGGRWSLPYHAELAQQDDTGDNPDPVDAGYRRFEVGGDRDRQLSLRLGVELLEGSVAEGRFTTPLATLHKFNGWADQFLSTPGLGLEDRYLSVAGRPGRLSWTVILHDFRSDAGSVDYGSEIDAELAWEAPWKQRFALTLAVYDADAFSTDTEKIWLWTQYAF